MNEYDSSRMVDLLKESHGYQLTENEGEADLLLLNTCSIREKAQEKVFHQLGRWRKLKVNNPDLKIGVGGCVASQEGTAIGERTPFVDLIFGSGLQLSRILLRDSHYQDILGAAHHLTANGKRLSSNQML